MTTKINQIRKRIYRFGWLARDKNLLTLGGDTLWLVSVKQDHQSFSVRGHTRMAAWKSAWDLIEQIHKPSMKSPMVIPFPVSLDLYRRAG
jgi:hypothetical protein